MYMCTVHGAPSQRPHHNQLDPIPFSQLPLSLINLSPIPLPPPQSHHSPSPSPLARQHPLTMAEGHYDQSVSNGSIPPSPGPYTNGSTVSDRIASPDAHTANGYTNGATSPTVSHGGMQPIQSQSQTQAQAPVIRKKLASWVGFSNLPNQVHRRAMRCVERDGMARRTSGASDAYRRPKVCSLTIIGAVSTLSPWLSVRRLSLARTSFAHFPNFLAYVPTSHILPSPDILSLPHSNYPILPVFCYTSLSHIPTLLATPSLTFPGESGLGKSTLINTLFETKLYGPKSVPQPGQDRGKTVQIESTSAGERWLQALHHLGRSRW